MFFFHGQLVLTGTVHYYSLNWKKLYCAVWKRKHPEGNWPGVTFGGSCMASVSSHLVSLLYQPTAWLHPLLLLVALGLIHCLHSPAFLLPTEHPGNLYFLLTALSKKNFLVVPLGFLPTLWFLGHVIWSRDSSYHKTCAASNSSKLHKL